MARQHHAPPDLSIFSVVRPNSRARAAHQAPAKINCPMDRLRSRAMTGKIQKFVRSTDEAIARVYLSLFKERNALLPFLFHSLFRDEREIELNLVDPLDRTTIAKLRQFIEYYLDCGYRFVS